MKIECDGNCFECPYPDVPEECLKEPITRNERKEQNRRDAEVTKWRMTERQRKERTAHKAWRKSHPEYGRAYQAKWRKNNRAHVRAYHRAYYASNRDEFRAKMRRLRAENRKKYAAHQKWIAVVRKQNGMNQAELAAKAQCGKSTLSNWETGIAAANWDKLCAVLPELEEYRQKGGKK